MFYTIFITNFFPLYRINRMIFHGLVRVMLCYVICWVIMKGSERTYSSVNVATIRKFGVPINFLRA